MHENRRFDPPPPDETLGASQAPNLTQPPQPVTLPDRREGETPDDFVIRAQREVLNLLDSEDIPAIASIKSELQVLDRGKGRPTDLDMLGAYYEEKRLGIDDSEEGRQEDLALQKLSVTARAVSTFVNYFAAVENVSLGDAQAKKSLLILIDMLEDQVHVKTPELYSPLTALMKEVMRRGAPQAPAS